MNTSWRHITLLFVAIILLLNVQAQKEERFTLIVTTVQPISNEENDLFEEVILTQIEYYLNTQLVWEDSKLSSDYSAKKVTSKLNELVKEDVKFHDYEPLQDFKSFSNVVEKKLDNIFSKTYDISSSQNMSSAEVKTVQKQHQLGELLTIIKTELLVLAEKDVTTSETEYYPDLTQQEKEEIISEIENFQDGDMLESISLSYEEMKAEDSSGAFIGKPAEKDISERILDLLAENTQKLERLESELSQLKIEGVSTSGSVVSSAADKEVFDLLPEKMNFYFRSGSYQLTSATLLQLNELVEILARSEHVKVVITGYADISGNPTTNLQLSKKRAQAVKNFMKESGLAENRFVINYYGESKSNAVGNQERRVEIKFFLE